ncbi:MAG: energy transducer TonB [Acidobacteriota bacterium]
MKQNTKIALFVLLLLWASLTAFSQTLQGPASRSNKRPDVIFGGVVNGKAVTLPKPAYPEDARRAKLSGVVKAKVLIDETGKVTSAETVEGLENVSLRQSAETAALGAVFSPTTLSGQPVKVSGIIVYNFAAVTNEERVKVLGVSTMLYMARTFPGDPEFAADLTGGAAWFPAFADELRGLAAFKDASTAARAAAVDKVIVSVRARLTESEKWQFDIGQAWFEVIGPIKAAANANDPAGVDEADIKLKLSNLRQLTLSAPPDFPLDVLQKLKGFAALADQKDLFSEENKHTFMSKFEDIIEAISPGSTK